MGISAIQHPAVLLAFVVAVSDLDDTYLYLSIFRS